MLKNFQLALITGATSGIGESLAYHYHKMGVSLILVGRNQEKLQLLEDELGATVVQADLSTQEGRGKVVSLIGNSSIDLVINSAGFGHYNEALIHPIQNHLEMIEVNVCALTAITLAAAKRWQEQKRKGTILNISSAAAFQVFPFFATYSATKAFVNSFSQSIYYELKPLGIDVLTSCPGMVHTGFRKNAGGGHKKRSSIRSMTAEYAAKRIVSQIESAKRLDVFDWRYSCLIVLGKCLPKSITAAFLKKAVKKIAQ